MIMSINGCMCVWVSVYVRGWVAKEGILSSAFLTGIRVSRGSPLFIFVRRPYKELCLREPARPEEKTKDVSQSGVRLRSRESDIQAQDAGLFSRL